MRIDPYRIIGFTLLAGAILGCTLPEMELFISKFHLSLLVISLVLLGLKNFKVLFKESRTELLASDGLVIVPIVFGIGLLVILITNLKNLAEIASTGIGPSMSMVALAMFYALTVILFVLVPFNRKPLPIFTLLFPTTGTFILVMTFSMLLIAFCNS